MFYDCYTALCQARGISRSRAAQEMGLSNSTVTKWKNTGATPSGETLARVSAYFGVPVGELLGEAVPSVQEGMLFLPADTWIRLVLWMLIGLDVYACYGVKHSKLEHNVKRRKGLTILNMTGIALSVLSVITGLWHQQTVGWEEDKTLLAISFVFAFTHCAFYMVRIWKQTSEKKK